MSSGEKKIVNGYILDNNFRNVSGSAQWTFAEKDGKRYFIKKFYAPTFPKNPDLYSPEHYYKLKCDAEYFFSWKKQLYETINLCDTGNVVCIHDFFLNPNPKDGHYYVVTEKVDAENLGPDYISRLSYNEKLLLLKVIAYNFEHLQKYGIVYADVRFDNILMGRSRTGQLIPKLIDFDSSFLESVQPCDGYHVSENFISPELAEAALDKKNVRITCKSDIYSLGLLMHLYWTGSLPAIDEKYPYVFAATLDDAPVTPLPSIPGWLRSLISQMLNKDPALRPSASDVLRSISSESFTPPSPPSPAVGGFKMKISNSFGKK